MADFEKVYRIGFDTSRATSSLKAFEARVKKLEQTLARVMASPAVKSSISNLSGRMKTASSSVSDSALRMRASIEKSLAGIGAKAAPAAAGMSKVSKATQRVADAGRVLDAVMKKSNASAAAVARGITKLSLSVERAVRKEADAAERAAKKAADAQERAARRKADAEKRFADKYQASLRRIAFGTKTAEDRMRGFTRSIERGTFSLTGFVTKIASFVAVGMGVRKLVGDFVDFDAAAVGASARLDKSVAVGTAGYKRMRQEVRALAKAEGFRAADAMKSVESWAKAGLNKEQVMAVMPATLQLSQAAPEIDVAEAGDKLSDALGGLKLRTNDIVQLEKNITRVSDVVVKAADISTLDPGQIFESFTVAAPMIDAVGGSVEQLAADLVILGNAGIKGSEAGTALRSIYGALLAPRGPAEKAMKKLGVEVKDATGNFRGLTPVLADFVTSTAKMGTGEKAGILTRIVGRENISSFLNLISAGAEQITAVETQLQNASGNTARIAEIMRKTVRKQFADIINNAEDVGLSFLENTNLLGRLSSALKKIDWKAASKWVDGKLLPALESLGAILVDVVLPVLGELAVFIRDTIFPVVSGAAKFFRELTGDGAALAKALAGLLKIWIGFKVLKGLMAFGEIIAGFRAVAGAAGAASTASAGLLGNLNAIAMAGAAGVGIGTILYQGLVKPFQDARKEAGDYFAFLEMRQKGKLSPEKMSDELLKTEIDKGKRAIKEGGVYLDTEDWIKARKDVERMQGELEQRRIGGKLKAGEAQLQAQAPKMSQVKPDLWSPPTSESTILIKDLATSAKLGEQQLASLAKIEAHQRKMITLAEQRSAPKVKQPANVNVTVAPANITITTTGSNQTEIEKILDAHARKNTLAMSAAVRNAAREVAAYEY